MAISPQQLIRSTYRGIARIARSSLRYHSFLVSIGGRRYENNDNFPKMRAGTYNFAAVIESPQTMVRSVGPYAVALYTSRLAGWLHQRVGPLNQAVAAQLVIILFEFEIV